MRFSVALLSTLAALSIASPMTPQAEKRDITTDDSKFVAEAVSCDPTKCFGFIEAHVCITACLIRPDPAGTWPCINKCVANAAQNVGSSIFFLLREGR